MKGYLDKEQLKDMKYEELQALAKKIGVSAGGRKEELADRIAAVEVDIPEESELTEEEKAAAEAARQEEGQTGTGQEAEGAAEKAPEGQGAGEGLKKATEERKKPEEKVTVKVMTRFLDRRLNQIKDAGEVYGVSRERAEELAAAGVAEIAE